jgi:hypothetical protein
LNNLTNLIEFKWDIETDEEYRPESLFASEISSRLPQLRRTNFRFTIPGNLVTFQFLETLKVQFRQHAEMLELLTLCREQHKLPFLKAFQQSNHSMMCTYFKNLPSTSGFLKF